MLISWAQTVNNNHDQTQWRELKQSRIQEFKLIYRNDGTYLGFMLLDNLKT